MVRGDIKIAFVYYSPSSFVMGDLQALSRHFVVEEVRYRKISDIVKLIRAIRKADLSFSWFADGHSFLAVLFSKLSGKKSVVVAGGYDVASDPELGYGQYTLGWHKRLYTYFALKHADAVLAVSQFSAKEVLSRARPKRIEVVYNGVNTERFKPKGKKEDLVLTVGSGSGSVLKLKGIDTFVQAAKLTPESKFAVLGLSSEDMERLKSLGPSENVELRGYVSQDELVGYYQRARVYCQLSYRESFGMALAEAMACGCTPVVTERAALPEVVGDMGFYVPFGDSEATAAAIKAALSSDKAKEVRSWVESRFGIHHRELELVQQIHRLFRN
jgi:glycosyltransferase involved in cell wall biosynthesis